MKVTYVSKNVRNDKLKHFTVAQGSCTDGEYIYIAFERKASNRFSHAVKIAKLSVHPLEIKSVSKPLKIGHANDMCIRDGILYITHSGKKKVIHRVDAKTLKKLKDIKVKAKAEGFNGIACYGSGYILRGMGGQTMYVTNKDFKVTRTFKRQKSYSDSQGITMQGKQLVCTYSKLQSSDKNIVAWFDLHGKLLKKKKLEITGELESVFVIDKELWFVVYRKKVVDGNTKYYGQIVKER